VLFQATEWRGVSSAPRLVVRRVELHPCYSHVIAAVAESVTAVPETLARCPVRS